MLPPNQDFRFGPFTFSRVTGLRRDGLSVPLRHLERQLLKCLLDRAGEIVRKEEIESSVWPNTNVAPNTINVEIRRLRLTLGDDTRPYQLLKSFPKMGYMLVATPTPKRVASVDFRPTRRDSAKFVRDVTVPDGSLLIPNQRFEKIWEIQNTGSVHWLDRRLRRIGANAGPGRIQSESLIPVPEAAGGHLCLIRASLVAPEDPGSYYAAWKMVDRDGRVLFPKQRPLFVSIDVIEDH